MKKTIEQQLLEKRDRLDLAEPPAHLWEGIREKCQPTKRRHLHVWWKVAAVFFLMSSIALVVHNVYLQGQVDELASLGDISGEYRKMEKSYQREITQLTRAIPLEQIAASPDFSWAMEELQTLEAINEQYRKDIGSATDQDKLVKVLIDYYEKKIRLLRKIQLEINRLENEKTIDPAIGTV